ncbi:phage tail-collar fiber domain-containing protein [Aeromonas dhakensis]|uniref:phage tail-collar fiber domain-containing protein n=1 Tax=Aeromonas dhakensis TaxID=196024 RepID=UPI0039873013
MSQVITNAFEQYWQSSLAAEQPVVLDEFVLADIPNLDITSPIDPDAGLPPESQIVHRQNVDQRGRINNNAVAYSIVMDTTVGDFSFNAMFLRNKANGVIGMIVYKGRETKLKTDQTTGQTGNSLVKSMLMGYDQAAEATLTNVDAGTWQIDYAARLRGQDEDLRQLASQLYGHHTFIGDGFKVVQQDGGHQVTQGVAIVGGLRIELKQPQVIYPGTKPIGVWVDVHRSGSLLSEHQNHVTIITSVADLTDHVDGNGYQHYVAKLGTVQADSTVIDGRGQGGSGGSGAIPDTFALWKRSMAEAGYDLIGQFGTQHTIQNAKQVLLKKDGTEVYAWLGALPKDVPADATPENTGGIGAGAWQPSLDKLLLHILTSAQGAATLGIGNSRTQADKNAEVISIGDYQPVGMDAFPQFQNALDDAVGKTLRITKGVYLLMGGTPLVRSDTHVIVDPGAIIRQPNKGKFGGFASLPGSKNILVEGFGQLIGPWEGGVTPWPNGEEDVTRWNTEQAENIGIDIRGRWYQRVVLGYNNAQMQALTDTSSNIRILGNLHIEGFGQSAIIADQVTRFTCRRPFFTKCGRDGLRMYGVRRFDVEVDVDTLAPGFGGDAPNFNVYGVTATRLYGSSAVPDPNMTIGRKSAKGVIKFSTVRNCFTWKGLDTHGGEDIKFIANDVEGCYIPLGIDKGGTDNTNGKAVAKNILVSGNTFSRGSGSYRRAGVTVFGHNDTDQMTEDVTIVNNTFNNVGGNDIDGAVSFSNVKKFKCRGNTYNQPTRAAISLQNRCINFDIGDETINTPQKYVTAVVTNGGSGYTSRPAVTVTGGGGTGLKVHAEYAGGVVTAIRVDDQGDGYTTAPTLTISGGGGSGATAAAAITVGFGVLVQTSKAKGRIDPCTFINEDQSNVIAVSLQSPAAGYGVAVSGESTYEGIITELSGAINERGGTYGTITRLAADISHDATGGINAISVSAEGAGYTTATVTITGGGGVGATATATIKDGAVTTVTVTDPGTGYTSEPNIIISGDGAGAAAIARAVGVVINAERGLKKAIRTGVGLVAIYPAFEDFTATTSIFPDAWARSSVAQTANCYGTSLAPSANFTVRTANTANAAVDTRFYCEVAGY